jgi:hypothetical protein
MDSRVRGNDEEGKRELTNQGRAEVTNREGGSLNREGGSLNREGLPEASIHTVPRGFS